MMKYRVIRDSEEITVILEDGGIATIRDVDEDEDGRKSVTEYYQDRFTQEGLDSCDGVWGEVGEGKMYCGDWKTEASDPAHIVDALNWLAVEETFELDESIWPDF